MPLCLCVSSCPPPSLFVAPPCVLTGWWPSPAPTYFTSRREFLGELSPTPSWRKSSSPKRYSRSSLCVVSVDPPPPTHLMSTFSFDFVLLSVQTRGNWRGSPSSWTGTSARSRDGSGCVGTRTGPACRRSSARACEFLPDGPRGNRLP